MNIVYLLGIVLAFVFVIFGITFDPGGTGGLMVGPFNLDTLINFVDPASILIVLGGTLAVVVACYPKLAKSFPKHFKIMLRLDAFNPEQYVEKLTELAQIARKNGLLALEEKAKEQEDPFFQQAIMLIVDANDPDRVRSILENDIEQTSERHQEVIAMYERGSNAAPAFGMIGTLIGLINMLKNLSDSDMETLGPSMSVALDHDLLWFAVGACPVQPHRVEPDGPGRRGDPLPSDYRGRHHGDPVGREPQIPSGAPDDLYEPKTPGRRRIRRRHRREKRAEAPQGEISRGLLQGGGTHDEKEKKRRRRCQLDGYLRRYGDLIAVLFCHALLHVYPGQGKVDCTRTVL